LIFVLLLSLVLLVMGMGFLSQRVGQNRAANKELRETQARALAEAGLEDVRIKLAKRNGFPPIDGRQQTNFLYVESLRDASGQSLGTYQVDIDATFASGPTWLMRITSRGFVGTPQSPEAEVVLFAEIDVSEWDRAGIVRSIYLVNPDRFRIIYLKEG
jgi:hypothetical protein